MVLPQFAFGKNDGQLGVRDGSDCLWLPRLLSSLPLRGVAVVRLSTSRTHTLAVTSDGVVLAWGLNALGVLGTGDTTSRATPTHVTALSSSRVVDVSCSDGHSLAVDAAGVAFAWGSNSHGQLGVAPSGGVACAKTAGSQPPHCALPVRMPLRRHVAAAVAAGAVHSVFVTSAGVVLTCGGNTHMQLGRRTLPLKGSAIVDDAPDCAVAEVSWGFESDRAPSITAAAAGDAHTVLLSDQVRHPRVLAAVHVVPYACI